MKSLLTFIYFLHFGLSNAGKEDPNSSFYSVTNSPSVVNQEFKRKDSDTWDVQAILEGKTRDEDQESYVSYNPDPEAQFQKYDPYHTNSIEGIYHTPISHDKEGNVIFLRSKDPQLDTYGPIGSPPISNVLPEKSRAIPPSVKNIKDPNGYFSKDSSKVQFVGMNERNENTINRKSWSRAGVRTIKSSIKENSVIQTTKKFVGGYIKGPTTK